MAISSPSPLSASRGQQLPGWLAAMQEFLALPGRVRLSEAQRALAAHMTRHLVEDLLGRLELGDARLAVWDQLWRGGLPFAAALAPHVLARVQEHRWRSAARTVLAAAPPGAQMWPASSGRQSGGGDDDPYDRWMLDLAISDARRHDALGGPLLAPGDLPDSLCAIILTDLAAVALTLSGPNHADALALAQQVDAAVAGGFPPGMEAIVDAVPPNASHPDALSSAMGQAMWDGNWPMLLALLARQSHMGYTDLLLWLTTSPAEAVRTRLAGIACPQPVAMAIDRVLFSLIDQPAPDRDAAAAGTAQAQPATAPDGDAGGEGDGLPGGGAA